VKATRRHAPPVGVTLSGGGAWRAAQALLAAGAGAAFTGWLALLAGAGDAAAALSSAAAAVVAGAAAWLAARPLATLLRWDGQQWSADGAPGEVGLMLDLGAWLLLRFRPAAGGGARWLPVPDGEAGPARHALRAALYSRAALHTPPAAAID